MNLKIVIESLVGFIFPDMVRIVISTRIRQTDEIKNIDRHRLFEQSMALARLQLPLIEFSPVEEGAFFNVILIDNLNLNINQAAFGSAS
jgi:hypothetical protein